MREMGFRFAAPTEADIMELVAEMREADRREVKRWTGQDIEFGVRHSVEASDCVWAARFSDGSLACLFGACRGNILDGTGVIWELGTKAIDRHKKEFWVGSSVGLDMVCRAMADVGEFVNFVDLEYTAAVRWIERMGAAFSVVVPKRPGFRGGEFGYFYYPNPYYKEEV